MSSYTEDNESISEMRQNLLLLQEVGLLAAFPLQALKLLALIAERVVFYQDENIFETGDDVGRAFLVLSGALKLHLSEDANETTIKRYHDGDFFGIFTLFGSTPALYSLTAAADTKVLTFTREHMDKIFYEFPKTRQLALDYLTQEIHQWERKILHMGKDPCLSHLGLTIL